MELSFRFVFDGKESSAFGPFSVTSQRAGSYTLLMIMVIY